jgi:hypothetical protein
MKPRTLRHSPPERARIISARPDNTINPQVINVLGTFVDEFYRLWLGIFDAAFDETGRQGHLVQCRLLVLKPAADTAALGLAIHFLDDQSIFCLALRADSSRDETLVRHYLLHRP